MERVERKQGYISGQRGRNRAGTVRPDLLCDIRTSSILERPRQPLRWDGSRPVLSAVVLPTAAYALFALWSGFERGKLVARAKSNGVDVQKKFAFIVGMAMLESLVYLIFGNILLGVPITWPVLLLGIVMFGIGHLIAAHAHH